MGETPPACLAERVSMASLEQTFDAVYDQVGLFIGWGSSPAAGDVTKAKNITYRGYRRFLQPINMRNGKPHVWSFLKQHGTIITVSGQWQYDLPADFGYLTRSFSFAESKGYPRMQERSVNQVMDARVITSATSYPFIFATRNGKYIKEIGTLKEVIFNPTPGSNYTLNYSYIMSPPKPIADTDFFVGGPWASEAIMECALAMAELEQDDTLGVHNQKAEELIQQLIQTDLQNAPRSVGKVVDTGLHPTDYSIIRYLSLVEGIYE